MYYDEVATKYMEGELVICPNFTVHLLCAGVLRHLVYVDCEWCRGGTILLLGRVIRGECKILAYPAIVVAFPLTVVAFPLTVEHNIATVGRLLC